MSAKVVLAKLETPNDGLPDADRQSHLRAALYVAFQKTLERDWDESGRYIGPDRTNASDPPSFSGSYRAMLWCCLGYMAGDARAVERANRIIVANYIQTPCHFTPGAAIDLLHMHEPRLTDESRTLLRHYLELNLPVMSTEDLKVHGYNDNHPMKSFHALIVGGEMLGMPHYVELGIRRMRQALALYRRNGFPCEYNSPTYTPVSINPLARIVEQAQSPEARDLALRLEQHFWRDLALHFDGRAGLPAGPYSRGYSNCYSGLLSNILALLAYLFPHRFDFDLANEVFGRGPESRLIDLPNRTQSLSFYGSHSVWLAGATYHPPAGIEQAIFEKPAGAHVRGTIESGTSAITWPNPEDRPAGAPSVHHLGPRRSLITTWFDNAFALGTAQYSWLDNGQSHGMVLTLSKSNDDRRLTPELAAIYYARMFFDERCPHQEQPETKTSFHDDGEIRTLQHRNTAMVLYNPHPLFGRFKRLRTGLFRPLSFSTPNALYVGDHHAHTLNHIADRPLPVAIDEGSVYVGIIPLRLTNHGQSRNNHLQVHTYGKHLSILLSSFEDWGPESFDYERIVSTCSGFVLEVHSASDFGSFAEFRRFLAEAQVDDAYYAQMRTTTYRRRGLELSTSYSPYQSAFRHASIDGVPVDAPQLKVEGL